MNDENVWMDKLRAAADRRDGRHKCALAVLREFSGWATEARLVTPGEQHEQLFVQDAYGTAVVFKLTLDHLALVKGRRVDAPGDAPAAIIVSAPDEKGVMRMSIRKGNETVQREYGMAAFCEAMVLVLLS